MSAAIAVIQFILDLDDGTEKDFLRLWNEGEFDKCRKEWPEAPEAVYIGADPMHPQTILATEVLTFDDVGFGWSRNGNQSVTRRGPSRPPGFSSNTEWYTWAGAMLALKIPPPQVDAKAKYENFCKLRDEMGKPRSLGGTCYPKYSEREAFEEAIKCS